MVEVAVMAGIVGTRRLGSLWWLVVGLGWVWGEFQALVGFRVGLRWVWGGGSSFGPGLLEQSV